MVKHTDEDIHTANERRLKVWVLSPLVPAPLELDLPHMKCLYLCSTGKFHYTPTAQSSGSKTPLLWKRHCTSIEPKRALPQKGSHGYSQDPLESLPGSDEVCLCGVSCLEYRDTDRDPLLALRS